MSHVLALGEAFERLAAVSGGHVGDSDVDQLTAATETIERLTREIKQAQRSLLTGGTEHARDLGHLADRNAEIRVLDTSLLRAKGQLAERTRERDSLAGIVGSALIRASLAPGESMDAPTHALTEAIEQLRGDREQLTRERDDAQRRTEHLLGGLSWAEATAANPMHPETTEEPKP